MYGILVRLLKEIICQFRKKIGDFFKIKIIILLWTAYTCVKPFDEVKCILILVYNVTIFPVTDTNSYRHLSRNK